MRLALGVVAATLMVAGLVGCLHDDGDGDESASGETAVVEETATTSTAPPPATTTEPANPRPEPSPNQSPWAAAVDDACEPVQERIDALPPPTDAASLERWLGQALPLVREQIAAVKAVDVPPGAQARTRKRLITSLESLAEALTDYRNALAEDDSAAIQEALVAANAAGAAARKHATDAGITACGGYEG